MHHFFVHVNTPSEKIDRRGAPYESSIGRLTPGSCSSISMFIAAMERRQTEMNMDYADLIDEVEAEVVVPVHGVTDEAKAAAIAASLLDGGWQGRPLVGVDYGDSIVAMTGSHRYAGAARAGVEIPVIVLPQSERLTVEYGHFGPYVALDGFRLTDDTERRNALRELAAESPKDAKLAAAAELLAEECKKNEE